MTAKNQSDQESRPKPRTRFAKRGEPKAVGPQVPIDPDNPKPPGINPKAQPASGEQKDAKPS